MWIPGDLAFNGILLALDAVALVFAARAARDDSPGRVAGVGILAALGAFGLAIVMQRGPFHLMRLQAFVIFVHVPFLLLGSAWLLRREAPKAALAGAAALLTLAVGFDAFLVEPHWLEVREVRLESSKLTRPLRIAVVADLQTDRIGPYERDVLARVAAARPDLILMPGDYLQVHERERREEEAAALRNVIREVGFAAPLGAYATRGNVEPDDWPSFFDGVPVTPVPETTAIDVGEIRVTALDLRDSFDPSFEVRRSDRFHIAFGHAPNFALGRVEADLLIAGHTHGGQVRLPFLGPVITLSAVPRAWAAGVTDLEDSRTLVVSRGIGMERNQAPRLRFLCRPELVFIDVQPR